MKKWHNPSTLSWL